MIQEAIVKIVNKEDLTYDEAYQVMNEIMGGETSPTQNAAFLAALSTKSTRAETIPEITGCAAAMREHAVKGVFVNQPPELVAELQNQGVIMIAQLHGHENEAYLSRLRELTRGKPVWKAFRVRTAADVEAARRSAADRVLLDNGTGTGAAFDWTLVHDMGRPWILAGGLTPETLPDAGRSLRPWCADLSSGVETDGRKDPAKILAAVEALRKLSESEGK